MKFEVWNLVGVQFPNQENIRESTFRPAIILEDLQDEVEICPVTTVLTQSNRYKYFVKVDFPSSDAEKMGLTATSLIILDRKATIKKIRLFPKKWGDCPDSIIE